MGQRVTFDDGKYVDFDGDDPISDEDIAWAEQQVYGNTPPEPQKKINTEFGTDVLTRGAKLGLAGLGRTWDLAAGGLAGAISGPDEADKIFSQSDKDWQAAQQEHGFRPNEVPSEGAKFGMALGQFGGQAPLLAAGPVGMGIMAGGAGVNRTTDDLQAGVDPTTAYKAGAADAAGTAAGILIPAALPGKLAVRAASGAGVNVAQDEAVRQFTNSIYGEAYKERQREFSVGELGASAVIGAGVGATLGPKGKSQVKVKPTDPNGIGAKVDELLASQKPVEPPKLPEAPPRDPSLPPELLQELPPILPEQKPVEAPLPLIHEDAPTIPKRSRTPVEAETPLPTVDPHLIGERAVEGMDVTPVDPILGKKGPRNARTMDNSDVRPAEMSWFKVGDDGVVNVRETMNSLLDSPKAFVFPGFKDLSTKLLSYLDGTGLSVRVVDYQGVDGGLYQHRPHEILLKRGAGDNNYVLMHELVHAATGRWMQDNLSHPLVRQLDDLRQSFIKQFGDNAYGVKDVHEFVAEANANPKFQAFLKQTPEARTKFQKIKDKFMQIARSVLGLSPKEANALTRALSLSDKVMQKQRPEALAAKQLKDQGINAAIIKDFSNAMKGNSDQIDVGRGTIGKIEDYIASLSKRSKDSTSVLAKEEQRIAAISKIPGMEMAAYIPKDISPDVVKAELVKEPDLQNGIMDNLISSKEMFASIKRNPALYTVGKWFTSARKRVELYDANVLQPMERNISKLMVKKEAGALMEVLKKEMYANARLTPENLAKVLTPKQVEAYQQLRQEFDVAFVKTNELLSAQGKKAITPHEAYVSSRWGGRWRTPVFDKEGRLVWWVAEHSRAKANHAMEWLKANHPELDYNRSKVEYQKNSLVAEGRDQLAGYRDVLALLGDDEATTAKLRKSYEDKMEAEGFQAYGHAKHLEPKKGTKGFAGERPWANDGKDVKAFFESQMAYLRETHLWAEQQTAVKHTHKLTLDADLIQSHPNTVDWIREMARNEMGQSSSKASTIIENSISKALGTDPSTASKKMNLLKSYFYTTKLGFFNVPFAVMSMVQPVFTAPHHVRLSDQGYDHNPLKTSFDAMTMAAATALPQLGRNVRGTKGEVTKHIPQLYQDAWKYMDANGIVKMNQFSDVGHMNMTEGGRKIRDTLNWSISAPETIARTTAFMGYVSHLDQSGKFKGRDSEMFQKAEELTNLSMANFKHTERAPAFNKAGIAGNALVTLKTFKINQLNQLYDFWKEGKTTGNYKAFATMLMVQTAMAGTMGIYGVETAEWMLKWLKKGLNEMGALDQEQMDWSLKKWMLENLSSLTAMGVTSQMLFGRDFHSRMDQGTILDPTMAGAVPFLSDIAEQSKDVLTFAVDPFSAEKRDRAIHSMAPASLKSIAEMRLPTMTGKKGQGDAFSADRPDEPLYKRTQADKDAKNIPFAGMTTLVEAREKMKSFKVREGEQLRTRALTKQTDRFHSALRAGNSEEAGIAIRKIATMGGEWEAIIDGATAELEKRATTGEEKNVQRALQDNASMQLLRKVKRQLEATRKMRENH